MIDLAKELEKYEQRNNEIAWNKAFSVLTQNPQLIGQLDAWLKRQGYKSYELFENGSFALVGSLGTDFVARLSDPDKEKPRENLEEIKQPISSAIFGHTHGQSQRIKLEVLERLVRIEDLAHDIGETEAHNVFSKARDALATRLAEKGFKFKTGVGDDSCRNIGMDKEGNFWIIDGDCIHSPERNEHEQILQQVNDFIDTQKRLPDEDADMKALGLSAWHHEVVLAQRLKRIRQSSHLQYLSKKDRNGCLATKRREEEKSLIPSRPKSLPIQKYVPDIQKVPKGFS